MKKKILSAIFAGLIAFNIFSSSDNAQAATRAEIAAISVTKPADFKYWADKSAVKRQIINYVKDVTNKKSKNFIPVEDRIAVFDMDGTILCETAPFGINACFPMYTVFEYPTDNVNTEMRTRTQIWLEALQNNKVTDAITKDRRKIVSELFAGVTEDEYSKRFKKFMEKPVEGLTNLKYGESFYLPMVEIISYLNANDFTVYLISGSERNLCRMLLDGAVDIKPNHVIGGDISYKFESVHGEKYYIGGDKIVFDDKERTHNTNTYKIFSIKREIGKKPVLAFGNSSGDFDMLNYTITDNKYKAASFILMCDDLTRELGDLKAAEKVKNAAKKNGWTTVSMKDDFKTIYGDNVKRSR